jgi:sulfur carrier protein ThiS
MRIEINHEGEALSVESENPMTISELLNQLGIHASTVLVVHNDTIVPHTSRIESDISLELIVVSSGG